MSQMRPFKRAVRTFEDGKYSNSGNWQYLLSADYAKIPQHYIRSFELIQNDLVKLFEYVEPSDQNKKTFSLKIHELLVRTCIEIEANFTAILSENKYTIPKFMKMDSDYCLVDFSHHLSSYEVKLPVWIGSQRIRYPFKNWKDKSNDKWYQLDWYTAYNKSKHERYVSYSNATFEMLIDAVCGLVALLSSQFLDESYSPATKAIGLSGNYSYDHDPEFETAIGGYFQVKYPNDWKEADRYGFVWEKIKDQNPIFEEIDYDKIKSQRPTF